MIGVDKFGIKVGCVEQRNLDEIVRRAILREVAPLFGELERGSRLVMHMGTTDIYPGDKRTSTSTRATPYVAIPLYPGHINNSLTGTARYYWKQRFDVANLPVGAIATAITGQVPDSTYLYILGIRNNSFHAENNKPDTQLNLQSIRIDAGSDYRKEINLGRCNDLSTEAYIFDQFERVFLKNKTSVSIMFRPSITATSSTLLPVDILGCLIVPQASYETYM